MDAGGAAADIVAAVTLHPNTPWHVLKSTREAMLQAAADQAAARASIVVPAAPPTTPKIPGTAVAMPQTAAQVATSSPLHSLAMAVKDSRLLHEAQLQAKARGLTPPPSPPDVAPPAPNRKASAVGTASSENKAVEVAPIDSYAAGSLPLLRRIRQLVKDR